MVTRHQINPRPIPDVLTVPELVDSFFLSYNAARLREACQLLTNKVLRPDVTVGLTLSGALTPAGLGAAAIVPLIERGFVDWIVSTGANLYHDLHRTLGHQLYQIGPQADDLALREQRMIRIYDIIMDEQVLYQTDAFLDRCLTLPEFQRRMSTAELHHRLGRYALEREKLLATPYCSVLAAAYKAGVPIYTPAPGDSTIGMNIAALRAEGHEVGFDPERDVLETTALVYHARQEGESAILILGGGSPKNFALQTEPQIQEIFGLRESGYDYYLQFTDARVDTGGLSGATPHEAMTWGKVNPAKLAETVICNVDVSIALPIVTAYVLASCPQRPFKRLYERLSAFVDKLKAARMVEKDKRDAHPPTRSYGKGSSAYQDDPPL